MKKKVSSVIAAILAALCIVLCFSACDFISYHASESRETMSYQAALEEKKAEYVSQLHLLASEDDFYDKELQLYRLQLIESVNKINECKEIEDLPVLYHSCEEAILSIKTIADYEEEEAQMKEELENAKLDWITKLKALSTAENYREAEKISYEFYLENGINAINAGEDIEGLEDIFNAYSEAILSIKTAAQYESEELEAFVLYCNGKVKEIKDYVVLEDYRIEERNQVSALIGEYEAKILDVKDNDYTAVDNLVRDFKIKVYSIPTDSELYAQELALCKNNAKEEIENCVNLIDYRANEALIVSALVEACKKQIDRCRTKEEVALQLEFYEENILTVKNDKALYAEELLVLVEECYRELFTLVNFEGKDDEYIQRYNDYFENVREEMLLYETKEEVRTRLNDEKKDVYILDAKVGDPVALKNYQATLIDELVSEFDLAAYRTEQQDLLRQIRARCEIEFEGAITFDDTMAIYQAAYEGHEEVLTNDEMWMQEDEEFRDKLADRYGADRLAEPQSLTEAKDYYELAEIIDFYAFYQLSFTEFLRDTFRVRLNFDHGTAQHEIDVVYWYCELLRTAVGITGWYENEHDLVIKLIPYALATESNRSTTEKVMRNKSLIEYDSDKTAFQVRTDTFDDFAYKKYGKTISGIWNTQQLWYALEHEYIPVCVKDSVAEKTLNAAKDILREIIMEGMSNDEKVFNIYSWFAENVQYDNGYANYLNPPDPENFPDEDVARLDSFFAEGVLLVDEGDPKEKRLAVCEAYAKSYLILLRLEGIESYRYLVRPMEGVRPKISTEYGYMSHAVVAIKNSSQKFYISDAEGSFVGDFKSFHQVMISPNLLDIMNLFTNYFPDMKFIDGIGEIYEHLKYKEKSLIVKSKKELDDLLSVFQEDTEDKRGVQISVFCNLEDYPLFERDIQTIDGLNKRKTINRERFKIIEYIFYM